MKSSLALILAVCSISYSVADETSDSVNWRYDNDTIPEMLPRNMLGKSNEEIEKAVFNAYQNQIRVVSEYSGHVYDPEFPIGYFKNECPILNSQTYGTNIDLIFDNNVFSGLRDYYQNVIIIKFAPNQIETIVEWKEANIKGNYYYLNSTSFDQGNYHIKLENIKYQAITTLTENTMKYPSSVPSSSISYKNVNAAFSGKLPTVTNINDSDNLKYFVEEVVFQHVADDVLKSLQPNISIAVRKAIKPYVIFRNVSDPHFKGFTGSTPSNIQLEVDQVIAHGVDQTLQRVKNISVDMANKKLIASTEMVMHDLSGTFRVNLTNGINKYTDYVNFEVEIIDIAPISNMFNRDDCTASTTIKNAKVTVDPARFNLNEKEVIEVTEVLENGFSITTKNKFDTNICKYLANMLNTKAGDF